MARLDHDRDHYLKIWSLTDPKIDADLLLLDEAQDTNPRTRAGLHRPTGRHRPPIALDNAYHVVSGLGDAAMALCAITFLAWLLRVRDNARALSGQPPRYAWPWIYAGWIVPVAHRKRPGRPSGT